MQGATAAEAGGLELRRLKPGNADLIADAAASPGRAVTVQRVRIRGAELAPLSMPTSADVGSSGAQRGEPEAGDGCAADSEVPASGQSSPWCSAFCAAKTHVKSSANEIFVHSTLAVTQNCGVRICEATVT